MGLLAPWFLAGLLALGVPVFLHLLRRHATTPRLVGSLMFFERGTQHATRHRRLRYLFLFALRLLLLLLVILAFANPIVRRPAADPNGRLLLIVVDRSFSMKANDDLSTAKRQAAALLGSKPAKQRAQVLAMSGHLQILTPPTTDGNALRSAIESISQGDERASFGDLGQGVRRLAEVEPGPIDLHLFSDMQRTAMPGNFADLALPANSTLDLPKRMGSSAQANWTVASVEAPSDVADPHDSRHSHVEAVIQGFGTPAATRTVALLVNGREVATRKVEVPASGRVTVIFAPLAVTYGANQCEVRLTEADAFSADNLRYFAVRQSDPRKVLFVHAPNDTRSAVYFNSALEAAAHGSFLLQPIAVSATAEIDPSRYAFVVLSDAVDLPSGFVRSLARYVEGGGDVLVTVGTRSGRNGALPLWKGQIERLHAYADRGLPATVGQVDFTYPGTAQREPGHDAGGWAGVKFLYAADVAPGAARVVARLNDGTPLLLDQQTGLGHVVLLTSGLDNLTNDLPLHPVFVAFVDRMARYLAGDERTGGARMVGDEVDLRPSSGPVKEETGVEVLDPSGRRVLSLQEARTARSVRLTQRGFYEVRLASGRDEMIGVNADPRESDLEPVSAEVERLWTAQSAPRQDPSASAKQTAGQRERFATVWWYLILLALLTAIVETAVASGYLSTQREQA